MNNDILDDIIKYGLYCYNFGLDITDIESKEISEDLFNDLVNYLEGNNKLIYYISRYGLLKLKQGVYNENKNNWELLREESAQVLHIITELL